MILPCRTHGGQVGCVFLNGCFFQQTVRCVENICQTAMVVFQPHEHIHENGLMSLFPQSPADAAAADQSHMAFGAEAAGQNHDLHDKRPPFMANAYNNTTID